MVAFLEPLTYRIARLLELPIGANMKLKLRSTLMILTSALVFSGTALAQKNYKRSTDYGVTIYEHCDFKGKSRTLGPGDYQSLRDIGFGNDKVSSIRVSRGNEAVIYQHDDFRGAYARIAKDIRCFDKQWNDEASSVSVLETDYNAKNYRNDSQNNTSRNDRYNNQSYDGRNYDNRNDRRKVSKVNGKNVSEVVFDGVSLQQIAAKEWVISSSHSGAKQFEEVRRDQDSVYLKNKYTAERVRIDLFANDVTFVSRDGRQQRYSIEYKNAALDSGKKARIKKSVAKSKSGYIPSKCFTYKAYTRGGNGGVRFHGKEGFFQFTRKPITGRICHNGALTMELNKTGYNTDVIVEINNHHYRFGPGEKEHKLLNTWYRKLVKLRVGK